MLVGAFAYASIHHLYLWHLSRRDRLPLLTAAHEAIPESPAITVTLARVWAGRNEYLRAMALYAEALTLRPAQRDALLGRATMLTYLGRAGEAIEAATRLIDHDLDGDGSI